MPPLGLERGFGRTQASALTTALNQDLDLVLVSIRYVGVTLLRIVLKANLLDDNIHLQVFTLSGL